jgi:polyhydroxyalkanoate synthesis regulator phasin
MGEPDREETQASSAREALKRLAHVGVGAAALTAERADELAGEFAERGGIRREEARQLLEEAMARWRGDSTRLVQRAGEGMQSLFRELGLVRREDYEELELRVAQLEHRLRLVERGVEEPRALPRQ